MAPSTRAESGGRPRLCGHCPDTPTGSSTRWLRLHVASATGAEHPPSRGVRRDIPVHGRKGTDRPLGCEGLRQRWTFLSDPRLCDCGINTLALSGHRVQVLRDPQTSFLPSKPGCGSCPACTARNLSSLFVFNVELLTLTACLPPPSVLVPESETA